MEAALHAVAALNEQVGAPWPAARSPAVVYPAAGADTHDHRLQGEHYPFPQVFINECCADASALMEVWGCDWRVAFAAIRFHAAGLYTHTDLRQVMVAGSPSSRW
jgi:hypothetical protein